MRHALVLEDVNVSFGPVRALEGVRLQVPAGVVAGIVGPDGAGKTTLLRVCLGLVRPQTGTIAVAGHEVPRETKRVKSAVGYLPQRLGILSHMTVRENLEYFGALYGVKAQKRREEVERLLQVTGLGSFERRLAQHLSGGMKQKLALSCAVVHRPRLMLLDEPSTGLDPLSRRDMWELIYGLLKEEDHGEEKDEWEERSVVVATPSWDEAARCQWIVALDAGRVVWTGEPSRLAELAEGLVWEVDGGEDVEEVVREVPKVVAVGRRGQRLRITIRKDPGETLEEAGVALREALRLMGLSLRPQRVEPSLEDGIAVVTGGEDFKRPLQ